MTAWLLAGLLAGATLSQDAPVAASPEPPAAQPSPAAKSSPRPDPSTTGYRVGAGDVIGVTVYGNEQLSRTGPVQTSGTVFIPLLGDVPVAGLTTSEIKEKLTEILGRDYLVDPQVEVRVVEYHSQFVTVLGEVGSAGRRQLRGQTRLVDVLIEAGGLKPTASGELTVTRREGQFANGEKVLRVRLNEREPSPEDQLALETLVQNGDIITAFPKEHVRVEGEVAKPDVYVLDGELTVSAAIVKAGGLTRFGSGTVEIQRTDPATKATTIIKVSLKDVRKGKTPDVVLQPNDVVHVPRRFLF